MQRQCTEDDDDGILFLVVERERENDTRDDEGRNAALVVIPKWILTLSLSLTEAGARKRVLYSNQRRRGDDGDLETGFYFFLLLFLLLHLLITIFSTR